MSIWPTDLPDHLTTGLNVDFFLSMIGKNAEDCGPLTPQYLLSRKRYGESTRNAQRPLHPRGTRNDAASAKKQKFNRAMSKAIATRVRVLGRKLTQLEFRQLVAAVRKQITPGLTNFIARAVSNIETRVKTLELATPTHVSQLESAIAMFQTQVTVLREQAMRAIQENDVLSETCSHIAHKSMLHAPPVMHPFSQHFPNLGHISINLKPVEVLCCDSCLAKRQDSVFLWTGIDPVSLADMMPYLSREEAIRWLISKKISKVHPLSIQSVWSALVNLKYNRTFEESLDRKKADTRRVPDPSNPGKTVKIVVNRGSKF
nr:hypothetical protein [Aspergillus ochraceopetaliformis partitivirus 1]